MRKGELSQKWKFVAKRAKDMHIFQHVAVLSIVAQASKDKI